jgi:hypothetical protein
VLPLHECSVEPLQDAAKSVVDPTATEVAADPAAAESATEPLHSTADLAGSDADLTETFCLSVWF